MDAKKIEPKNPAEQTDTEADENEAVGRKTMGGHWTRKTMTHYTRKNMATHYTRKTMNGNWG
jgi:hypothetical protein